MQPRDMFECEYIARCIPDVPYQDAKAFLEERRTETGYDDEHANSAFQNWINGRGW